MIRSLKSPYPTKNLPPTLKNKTVSHPVKILTGKKSSPRLAQFINLPKKPIKMILLRNNIKKKVIESICYKKNKNNMTL